MQYNEPVPACFGTVSESDPDGMDVETASAAPQESPVQKRPAEHEQNGGTSPVPKRSDSTAVTRAMPLIPQLHVYKCGSKCLF